MSLLLLLIAQEAVFDKGQHVDGTSAEADTTGIVTRVKHTSKLPVSHCRRQKMAVALRIRNVARSTGSQQQAIGAGALGPWHGGRHRNL